MQMKLNFDPLRKEEVNRAQKIIDALSQITEGDAANEEIAENNPKLGDHERGGKCYKDWIMWPGNRATLKTMSLIDEVLDVLNRLSTVQKRKMKFRPIYNENYITQTYGKNKQGYRFLTFVPDRDNPDNLIFRPKIPQTQEADQLINDTGWNFSYEEREGWYCIHLANEDEIYDKIENLEQLLENTFLQNF